MPSFLSEYPTFHPEMSTQARNWHCSPRAMPTWVSLPSDTEQFRKMTGKGCLLTVTVKSPGEEVLATLTASAGSGGEPHLPTSSRASLLCMLLQSSSASQKCHTTTQLFQRQRAASRHRLRQSGWLRWCWITSAECHSYVGVATADCCPSG